MILFLLSSHLINDGVGRFHNALTKNDQIELSRHSIRSTSNTEPGVVDCTMSFSVEITCPFDVLRCWISNMPMHGLGTRLSFEKQFFSEAMRFQILWCQAKHGTALDHFNILGLDFRMQSGVACRIV